MYVCSVPSFLDSRYQHGSWTECETSNLMQLIICVRAFSELSHNSDSLLWSFLNVGGTVIGRDLMP